MRTIIVSIAIAITCFVIWFAGRNVEAGPSLALASGLIAGALFGLVALGLVLVYKGTRVFNFMQGEFGTLGAFFMFMFVQEQGPGTEILTVNQWIALPLAILCVMVIALVMERIVVRPLIDAPRITLLVATIALALGAIALEILIFRTDPLTLPELIAGSSKTGELRGLEFIGFQFSPQRLIVLGVLLTLGVVLAIFFSRTNLGLAVLATSQDAFATQVVGISVDRMSRFIWVTSAALGALAGILYVPIAGLLVPGVMTTNVLIPAFTGAVLGGMTSLPGAFLGGIVIGVVQSLSSWGLGHFYLGERVYAEVIPGGEYVSILVVLLMVLLIRPQGLVGRDV